MLNVSADARSKSTVIAPETSRLMRRIRNLRLTLRSSTLLAKFGRSSLAKHQ